MHAFMYVSICKVTLSAIDIMYSGTNSFIVESLTTKPVSSPSLYERDDV